MMYFKFPANECSISGARGRSAESPAVTRCDVCADTICDEEDIISPSIYASCVINAIKSGKGRARSIQLAAGEKAMELAMFEKYCVVGATE